MLRRPAILCAGLLFAALLVLGLVHIFELRFARGDLYPAYSTLRTDPLGASVLYESVDAVPGMSSERYFEDTFKRDDGQGHALLLLGSGTYSLEWLSRSEFDTIQRFVFNGGRVVIAYRPEVRQMWSTRLAETNDFNLPPDGHRPRHRHKPRPDSGSEQGSDTNFPAGSDKAMTNSPPGIRLLSTNNAAGSKHKNSRSARRHAKSPDDSNKDDGNDDEDDWRAEMRRYADLSAEWGFFFKYEDLGTNDDGGIKFPEARLVHGGADLPPALPIHTALYFTHLTNGWTTVYQRDDQLPVVVERKFGAGSVVLVADSYPFSNEALYKNRNAALLAWFLGSGRAAIFDEAHLGIAEQPGMATLMRRYQLHGLIFGLLLLSGLFVWKNTMSLVPPHAEATGDRGPVVAGRDSASGLVNLARRGIAPAELINVCFAEWRKSGARLAALSPAQRRDIEQLVEQQAALPPHQRKPVENYRLIAQILQRRK